MTFKRNAILAALGALGLAVSGGVTAQSMQMQNQQQADGMQQQSRGAEQPKPAMRFEQLDRNRDGYLDLREATAGSALDEQSFQQADRDRDRRLNVREFQAAMQSQRPGMASQGGPQQQPMSAMGETTGQSQAKIKVEEKPAKVQVTKQPPEVIVKQDKPEVEIRQTQPQVTVEQPQPEVTVTQAEPEVTVKGQGQPQVRVEQAKQADVDVETTEPTAQAQGSSSQQAGGLQAMRISELEGKTVINSAGNELGEIEDLVQDERDGKIYAVISVGGFLGIGDKDIALPVDELKAQDNRIVMTTDRSEDQLKQAANEYREERYRELSGDRTLAEISGGPAGRGGGQLQASFEELDQNGDGKISRSEAQQSPVLSQEWRQADRNNDQQLDQAEFSAFESGRAQQ